MAAEIIDMEKEEKLNLEHAERLWKGLQETEYGGRERVTHMWRILHIAQSCRMAPVLDQNKKSGVCDVVSMGVSADGNRVMGASSKLRTTARFRHFEREKREYKDRAEKMMYKTAKDVWPAQGEGAYDNNKTPRLKMKVEKDLKEKGSEMPTELDGKCAEPVIYEKLSRITLEKPVEFLYTVQKTDSRRLKKINMVPELLKYDVKIKHRCEKCMLAHDNLGHVVTDSEQLKDIHVPVLTPCVMKFFRGVTKPFHKDMSPADCADLVTVWLRLEAFASAKEDDKVLLPKSGADGGAFDEEISQAQKVLAARIAKYATSSGT